MEKDVVSQKILAELLELGHCVEQDEDWIWIALQRAYAAGYDEGRLQYRHRKPVGQYTLDGNLIKIYQSAQSAARAHDVSKHAISKAALGKTMTAAGYRWKYVNTREPTSETRSIEPMQGQTVRPKLRSHSSKKG